MIRLVKKNGEYFLQERLYKVVSAPAWKFWDSEVKIELGEWRTAETIDLDKEDHGDSVQP